MTIIYVFIFPFMTNFALFMSRVYVMFVAYVYAMLRTYGSINRPS